MPVISGAMKACKIKKEGHTNMVSSSVGLVIPFQPTIQSKADILLSLSFAMESVKIKLRVKYGGNYTTNVMDRFDKLCSKLNYNSHSKSIAIIISPKEDKLIYLGFRVKPAVFMGKTVTLADIVANAFTEPDFMILHVQEKNIKLFETNNGTINKIYEQNRHTNTDNLYKYTSGIIELMNIKNEKPIFVYGGPPTGKYVLYKRFFYTNLF